MWNLDRKKDFFLSVLENLLGTGMHLSSVVHLAKKCEQIKVCIVLRINEALSPTSKDVEFIASNWSTSSDRKDLR